MRRYLLHIFLLIMLLALSSMLRAQVFKGALMGGVNICQVDGDEIYGYHRFGAHVGAAAILPLKNWDITLETVYNQKGSYQKAKYPGDSLNGQYDLKLNYIEVPLLVHYTDKKFITGGVGFSWGRLIYSKEIEHAGAQPPYSDSVGFNKNDFNFLADVMIRVYKQLKFNIRFAYSVVPIRERVFDPAWAQEPWTRKQYNHLFTFRVVWVFNEKYGKRPKEPAQ